MLLQLCERRAGHPATAAGHDPSGGDHAKLGLHGVAMRIAGQVASIDHRGKVQTLPAAGGQTAQQHDARYAVFG